MSAYHATELRAFVAGMLGKLGMDADMARAMSIRVIDAELFGHRTHGLLFFPAYLDRIETGVLARSGRIDVIADRAATFTWRANKIAGAWVMERATAQLVERVRAHGVATASLSDCSHIGCLQTYLLPFTEQGLMVSIAAANPGIRAVAAFGGVDPVMTTNPMAFGIPTSGTPILIDQSTSVASNALFTGYASRGERLPGHWLLDAQGHPTDDPNALASKPPGTILPLGGLDFGHKGFGFGLFVEALAVALSGHGRAEEPDAFGQGVFIQAIDPSAFGGRDRFLAETDHLVASCRASRPRPGIDRVRVPGERALASKAAQEKSGVEVLPAAIARLAAWMKRLQVTFPPPIR